MAEYVTDPRMSNKQRDRNGKILNLSGPGSRKYLRIVEEFIKYVENISISSSRQTKYCQNKYIKDKYVISRLIIIIIVEFEHYCGPFFTKTTAEILYDQRLGRGNKTMFSMSGFNA